MPPDKPSRAEATISLETTSAIRMIIYLFLCLIKQCDDSCLIHHPDSLPLFRLIKDDSHTPVLCPTCDSNGRDLTDYYSQWSVFHPCSGSVLEWPKCLSQMMNF